MTRARSAIALALGLLLANAGVLTACGGPYTGKPDKLRQPSVRDDDRRGDDDDDDDDDDRPGDDDDDGDDGDGIAWDDSCRTNFYGEPTKKRNDREGKRLAEQASDQLDRAETMGGVQRDEAIVDSIETLSRALDKDPYGPEATFKMAVAYAKLRKRKCALRLLERLTELEAHPKVTREAYRVIERAMRDEAFDLFRKEADRALGR